ncbi:hypothetical protein RJ639_005816 [Escallonia herrerae]|uniref:Cytochrome P450 n=1 Tax=Escallonia herrerae TaxID=1293975 RepID=A0AA88VY59_9ASTE|nr:hypothetical protein RJ639_005816 [Escallonia herrerae]
MESLLSFTATIFACTFALLIFLCHYFLQAPNSAKRMPPEAAGAWPVIGHLHLLGGFQLTQQTLGSLADIYGPIFTIKLGVHRALVVSDWKMAKECLTTNDVVFASRPKSVASELMGYNYAMLGLSPYGPYWRQVRKVVMLEFLSSRRIEMLAPIRVAEVKASIGDIYRCWAKNKDCSNMAKMEMKQWFGTLSLNIAVKPLVGKRYSDTERDGDRFPEAMRKFNELLGAFIVSDSIPFLRWLDLGGYEKEMKKVAKEMDDVVQGWLEEHKMKRSLGDASSEQRDFMDAMLPALHGSSDEHLEGVHADPIIKATCLAILTAATDTTMSTLIWALALMLNNEQVMKKAQEEMDINVGRERQVEEPDMKNLVYLQAVIKETLRLYPPVPLSLPHESTEECTVGGYRIPKGTRLLLNLWKIHRDPQAWPDPSEFQPERFLTGDNDIDVRGQNYELIPFGSGRRMCPGISLGLQVLQLTLASVIHGFEFVRPLNEPIDMSESFGLTNLKATPLEVLLTPRLSPSLYGTK